MQKQQRAKAGMKLPVKKDGVAFPGLGRAVWQGECRQAKGLPALRVDCARFCRTTAERAIAQLRVWHNGEKT